MKLLPPSEALAEPGEPLQSLLPACVHYAGNEKFLYKALELQDSAPATFDIVCDLEDGSGPKVEPLLHAKNLLAVLESYHTPKGRVGLRIHGIRSEFWQEELKLFLNSASLNLAFLTLPKCRGVAEVEALSSFLNANWPALPLAIHVLIETHTALRDVWQIAKLARVEALEFGLLDFVSEHQGAIPDSALQSPGQFEHPLIVRAKTEIVSAALAHGKVPSHNISLALRDSVQVYQDALRAKSEFGFLRMWSIHPTQIEPIVRAFAPCSADFEKAGRVLLEAQRSNWAPIDYEGKLMDRASYRVYWSILRQAYLQNLVKDKQILAAFFPSSPASSEVRQD